MRKAMIALLALAALAGCATRQESAPAAGAQAAPADKVASSGDEVPLTGSRIARRKSTDRLLKSVGNSDARDSMDSAPDPLRSGQ